MAILSGDDLVSRLSWRYATKQFDPRHKISDRDWGALEQALVLTPSSFGLQPWKFVVVTDPTVKERLVAASWNQRQPADCSHHVIFCIKQNLGATDIQKLIDRTVELRGIPLASLDAYKKMMLGSLTSPRAGFDINHWAQNQVYIALGNFMTAAAVMGIDTCPMEGIVPAQYDELLGLAGSGFATVVACAAGYRAIDDKYAVLKKVRYERDEVIKRV